MSTDENNEQVALAARVASLETELKQYLLEIQKRSRRTGVVMVVLVVLVAAYGMFIYSRLPSVNADTAADMAYRRAVDFVQASPPVVAKALKDKAPEVFDFAEMKILQSPSVVVAYIRKNALDQTQFVLDQSEPKFTEVITTAIAHAKTATLNAGFDGKDPAQLDALMDKVAVEMRTRMATEFQQVNGQYEDRAQTMLSYMEQLAAGKNLDVRQQRVRNVIVSFLAVAEKHKAIIP